MGCYLIWLGTRVVMFVYVSGRQAILIKMMCRALSKERSVGQILIKMKVGRSICHWPQQEELGGSLIFLNHKVWVTVFEGRTHANQSMKVFHIENGFSQDQ